MNSEPIPPPIRMDRPTSFEEWLQGRRWRREIGNRVAPEVIRRTEGPGDRRLKADFNGERGLPFSPTDRLPGPLPPDSSKPQA